MSTRFCVSSSICTIDFNFVRYVGVMKQNLNLWRHHGGHLTWVQFTDHVESETQILYLKFYMGYWLQTLSDTLGWQKNNIHDIIMVVTWLRYDLQTRLKMTTRFGISSFMCPFDLKILKVMIIKEMVNSCWG